MAFEQYDRACLVNLGIKGKLKGSKIHTDEGVKEVSDFEFNFVENRVYIDFVGDSNLRYLNLMQLYVVDVLSTETDQERGGKKKKSIRSKRVRTS